MTDLDIEQEIIEKDFTASSVTPDHIEQGIVDVEEYKHKEIGVTFFIKDDQLESVVHYVKESK